MTVKVQKNVDIVPCYRENLFSRPKRIEGRKHCRGSTRAAAFRQIAWRNWKQTKLFGIARSGVNCHIISSGHIIWGAAAFCLPRVTLGRSSDIFYLINILQMIKATGQEEKTKIYTLFDHYFTNDQRHMSRGESKKKLSAAGRIS